MGYPMLTLATVDFGIQWIVWAFSAYFATERFYDLTGSLTFLLVTFLSLRLGRGGSNGGSGGSTASSTQSSHAGYFPQDALSPSKLINYTQLLL